MVCRPGHENDPVEKMRHSCAHVLADAVTQLFPEAKVSIGPCIDDGFYYDFDYKRPFTPEDLEKIEAKIQEIIDKDFKFEKKILSKKEALKFFENKNEKYKVELIESFPEDEEISIYQHGNFTDLCKGPHLESTKQIGAFKLLSVAGSYWRGDENRDALQRIYATAFPNKKELRIYLDLIQEAKKRDHRKLGRELELFGFHSESPASPFFYPKGALIYRLIIDYLRRLYDEEGYQEVITPQILDISLWEKSGHLEHFKNNMYFTEIENRDMSVKPMNCPGHCLMFGEKKWSYRELPYRLADFGRLHRYERSGVTHGLTRVRTFCQDDAHIFCMPEQMDEEIQSFLKLLQKVYQDFEFDEVNVALATRPKSFSGSIEMWNKAEETLKQALNAAKLPFVINEGEGAFYGPKIEFQIKDALKRPWQLGTLQVDYSMPERFDLNYIGSDGQKARPVMLHRAILGSLERFIGILLEHSGGALPLWLAPTQVQIIPILDKQKEISEKLFVQLKKENIRCSIDNRNEKLGLKIREAQLKKIPYMAVIGAKEEEALSVSLRHRSQGDLGIINFENLIKRLQHEGITK